mgnify:CR=1 FL=1
MSGKVPFAFRLAEAVGASSYPPEVRHLLLRLAMLADSRTGVGWHSQETIARCMGLKERQVRRLEQALAKAGGPVRLVREQRGPRQSEWRLELARQGVHDRSEETARQGVHDRSEETARQGVHDRSRQGVHDRSEEAESKSRPVIGDTLTGHWERLDRAYTTGPILIDLPEISQLISQVASKDASKALLLVPNEAPKRRASKAPKKPKAPADTAGHQRVTEHYFRTFEAKRGIKPIFGGAEGKAVQGLLAKCAGKPEAAEQIITNAFAGWMGDTVTIRDIASNPAKHQGTVRNARGAGPKQPNSGWQAPIAQDGEF